MCVHSDAKISFIMSIYIRNMNIHTVDDLEAKLENLKKWAWLNWSFKLLFFQKMTLLSPHFRQCIKGN